MRVKMFLMGHSFQTIDRMKVKEFGDVVGYLSGQSRAEEKQSKNRQSSGKSGGGRPRRR